MTQIKTFIIFDIETTGLPWQEKNQTKIIEASFIAVNRKDIEKTVYGDIPPTSKLTFLLNPQRVIHPEVVKMTGISNQFVTNAPIFKQKFKTLYNFINYLPQPVCLVAHNGNSFDFKILLAECIDAKVSLPINLFCVDSLKGFRTLLKDSTLSHVDLKKQREIEELKANGSLLTDDEEDWPDLDISTEDWDEIDDICQSFSDMSNEEEQNSSLEEDNVIQKRDELISNIFSKKTKENKTKGGYSLSVLYQRLINKDIENAHRAEYDCMMLLECIVAIKEQFLSWADDSCVPLTDIIPLERYTSSNRRRVTRI